MTFDGMRTEQMVLKYKDLIHGFVNRQVSAADFEARYLTLFKSDKAQVPSDEFNVLEKLFFAVDDYVADPELRKKVGGLNDVELRACAVDAYSKLYGN